jgi:hypothetical protein
VGGGHLASQPGSTSDGPPGPLPPQAALFEAAARAHPDDGDVHAALGVVYNLCRRYDDAVAAFR